MNVKSEIRSRKRKINDLIESIKTRINEYDNQEVNWSHVGTLTRIIDELNIVDNEMSGRFKEITIDEKIFNVTTRKFEKK